MSTVAISVKGLGKHYRLGDASGRARYSTLRDEALRIPARLRALLKREKPDAFWALKDVSFDVSHGEVLGVIGRNGAGKSTLLKVLSRILAPSEGSVDIFGRVGSLLEVGTGFHPELTGRENIYLSGAILGMRRREVNDHFDEIVAFAGVEQFIDTACKHYSSGMYSRLGFAVAAHLKTNILLVDEVLAVGDAEFKKRCVAKVGQLAGGDGRTVVFVSHEPALIRSLCSRVILMKSGRVEFSGTPDQALSHYHALVTNEGGEIIDAIKHRTPGMEIISIKVNGAKGRMVSIPANTAFIDVEVEGSLSFSARVEFEARLYDRDGNTLGFFSPGHDAALVTRKEVGPFHLTHRIMLPRLLRGTYSLRLGIVDPNFTCWVDAPEAVRLDVEGATTRLGMLTAGGHCGWVLLDEPNTQNARISGGSV